MKCGPREDGARLDRFIISSRQRRGDTRAHLFSRFVLLSPALPYGGPTYRPNVGGWATPFVGRIIALKILNRLGVRGFNGLPTVAFAVNPRAAVPLVASYSYRMQANFSSPRDALARFAHVTQPLTIMVGSEDELFYADRFAPLIHHACADVPVILVPGVDHMGMVTDPQALAAITSLISSESRHPDCAAGTGPTLAVVLPPQTGRH